MEEYLKEKGFFSKIENTWSYKNLGVQIFPSMDLCILVNSHGAFFRGSVEKGLEELKKVLG